MVKYLWRTQSSSVSEICPHPWVDWQCAQSIPLDQPHTDWATSANRGTTLKRIFEGPSHYGSEAKLAKLASWPQRIPLASFPLALPFPLRFLSPCASFRQFLLLASPPRIPLPAYVYAVLGVPPTQTGTTMPVLLQSYRRAFNSYCDYGSKVMTDCH